MSKGPTTLAALALAFVVLAAPLSANAQRMGLSNAAVQTPAANATSYSADPQQIAEYLRGRGQAAQVGTDNDGDPFISTSSQGARYSIYFYGCENGQNCNSISFDSAFRPTRKSKLEDLNTWNLKKRHAYAVQRTDSNVALRMDVVMLGSVSENVFTETVRLWDGQLGDFLRHIEF
ncbi:MAG: YbjN domain-containing protein [Hyphomicrobiaceae bacterium]